MARFALCTGLIAATLFLLPTAHAAEGPPPYSSETLIPNSDDELPGSVTLGESQGGDGLPCPATLDPIAKAAGLDEVSYYAEVRTFKAEGGSAHAAMIDIDTDPSGFRTGLDAAAAQHGWTVMEMGSPHRLLVVGGPESARNAASASLKGHVVLELVDMGIDRVFANARTQAAVKKARAMADDLLTRARGIDSNAGAVFALQATLQLLERNRLKGEAATADRLAKQGKEGKADEKTRLEAEAKDVEQAMLASVRKAFAPGVGTPARGKLVPFLAGEAGESWLATKDDAVLGDAVQMLELAMANEGTDSGAQRKFTNRYNLACGYARQSKKSKAMEWLRKALEVGKILPTSRYAPTFIHMRDTDEDLAPLRDDAAFKELLEAFHTDGVKKYEKELKERKAKQKEKEAAKEKAEETVPAEG